MVKNALVSIVVPVYKVEYWLPKCIRSVLAQTYENIELILVDDGSPDNSGKICDNFAKKDNRVKVIHKKNGGVSSARNVGIEAASGDYICFVDSDDWLARDAVETLYAEFLTNDIQICIANLQAISVKNRQYTVVNSRRIVNFKDPNKLFVDLYQEDPLGGLIGKMFVTTLIKENSIRLKEGMKFGEDVLFLLECYKYCDSISLIEKPVYFYNRLVYESAITRFYPELTDWLLLLTQSRYDLVIQKGEQNENGSLYVAKTALIDFEYIINSTCFQGVGEAEAVSIFQKAYKAFDPYFYPNLLKKGTVEYGIYDEIVENYCNCGDFEGLYKKTIKKYRVSENGLKRKVKKVLSSVYITMKRFVYRF